MARFIKDYSTKMSLTKAEAELFSVSLKLEYGGCKLVVWWERLLSICDVLLLV